MSRYTGDDDTVMGSNGEVIMPYEAFRGLLAENRGNGRLLQMLFPGGQNKPVDMNLVSRWRTSQDQGILTQVDEYLPLLSNPSGICRTSIVDDGGRALVFFAVHDCRKGDQPVLICSHRHEEKEIRVFRRPTMHHFASDLNDYITPGPPLSGTRLNLSIPGPSFLVLCAISDLLQRRLYASLLDHTTVTPTFTEEDIRKIANDAVRNRDIRWLLPHVISLAPDDPEEFTKGPLGPAFAWLGEHKYLEPGTRPGEFRCSETCRDLLDIVNSSRCRQGIMNLCDGGDAGIALGSVMFIRAPRAVLAANIGKDAGGTMVLISTLNFEDLLEFTQDFLAAVQPLSPAGPEPGPRAQIFPESEGMICPHCAAPLPRSAKFCRKCGRPVHPEV